MRVRTTVPVGDRHPVEARLAAAWPPHAWEDVTVLLAISGGADSVALLRAMVNLKGGGAGRLYAAHLNHQLRGAASDADEAFVVRLCHELGLPCEIGRVAPEQLEAASGDGLEAAARTARYTFLRQTAERVGARYVVTAHTADDQAETILHRILRGTGIAGLAGIPRARRLSRACTLIRPLLSFRRQELLAYLDDLQQPYRSDLTNEDRRFTRNRIRHEVLPKLAAEFNPSVVDALLRLGWLAKEVQDLVTRLVDELGRQCVAHDPDGWVHIDTRVLADQPRYLVRELLIDVWHKAGWPRQSMGFAEWDLLAEMALRSTAPSPDGPRKQVFPGRVTAEIQEGALRLRQSLPPP